MTLAELEEIKRNYKIIEIAVDFINPSYNISRAKHLDTARYIICTLTENGIPRTVKTNEVARIRLQKPDRTYVYNDCDILEDGRVFITLTEQILAVEGNAVCDIQLTDEETGIIYSTKNFLINIDKTAVDNSIIESSNEFDALNNLIATNKKLNEGLEANEQIRQENEEERIENEKQRIANENTRQTNESIRQTQETDRENNTAAAIANAETAAQKANDAADDLQAKLDSHHFVLTEDKDVAGGVPSLDNNAKVPIAELYDATTSSKGITQLIDSVTSTSTTTAATPNSVKTVNDTLSAEITRATNAESNLDSKKIDKTTVATSTTLGLIKSGTDITVDSSGNVSVNDNSHNHTVSNISDLTATASEINVLDGITATTTELNYTDGVTSNIQTQLNAKAPLASPSLTGTPTAPTAATGTNTTQIATTAFVQTTVSNGIAASDAMIIKGIIGTSGTVTVLPTTYKTGWTYRVVTAGTYAGQVCEIGDLIIALVDRDGSDNADSDWCVAQTNINGAITGIKNGDAYISVSQSGSVVTIAHKDVSRSNTTSTASPSSGGTFIVIDSVTSDSKGHVTAVNTKTVTLPSSVSGNAGTATKLATARTLSWTGDATGSMSVDGSANASAALTLASSGVTAGSYGQSANASPAHSGTFNVPYITVDAKGRVTSASTKTITLPSDNNTDTHYTSKNVVGSSTATSNTTSALTNGNVYLNSVENGSVTSSHKISGSGATTVTTDASGNIVITSTNDTNTTYSPGTGLTLSGTTFNHINSVVAGTAQGDVSKTLTFGGTFSIPTVTYDAQGHITGKGTTTMTMPTNPNTNILTGIKGNAESSYRTGNVNITPANLGITVVNNTADADKSVKYATSADTASKLDGFSSRVTDGISWGTLSASGYNYVTRMDTAGGGSVAFADSDGQTSMQIDGFYYQQEGQYRCLDESDEIRLNVESAKKDGDGNNISETYMPKSGGTFTGNIIIKTGHGDNGLDVITSNYNGTSIA